MGTPPIPAASVDHVWGIGDQPIPKRERKIAHGYCGLSRLELWSINPREVHDALPALDSGVTNAIR